jgi:hypothetical protein
MQTLPKAQQPNIRFLLTEIQGINPPPLYSEH